MIVRRERPMIAGSEAERLTGSFHALNDLPMEHQVRSFDRSAIVVRRREYGYRTVAYPGGVLKVWEVVGGKIPTQHRVHPEGLEAHYLPEIVAPPDFSDPLILSNTFVIPPLATNLLLGVPFPYVVPIGREAALKTAEFLVSDASTSTIRFQLIFSKIANPFSQPIVVSGSQRWDTPKRLEEQMQIEIRVTNLLAGFREVTVGLNGYQYLIRKKVG